ncbi:hypothetical protein IEC33019_1185 [Pseudomonas putida]|uniref:Uncharacterized protein n=1 Tax=Pseudomonas putida TaxID=303 RepID=A0A1B2F3H3_PSEPU|nr:MULTISPECIES: hypothetical protein [Pseudomonas]ANY86754.1 hypothetical protein IEC33019_1185 [Pseudomonas putida]
MPMDDLATLRPATSPPDKTDHTAVLKAQGITATSYMTLAYGKVLKAPGF